MRLELADDRRDLALSGMAVDSTLRGCYLVCLKVNDAYAAGHGNPPQQQAPDPGMQPSLSTDVECTMTADRFTQMRSAATPQR